MSDTISGAPSVSDYLNASYWAYSQAGTPYPDRDTTLPTGFSYFTVNGQNLIEYDPAVGLYAAAVIDSSGNLLVTFEGTNVHTGNDTFTAAQILDDASIVEGINAPSYQPALTFTQTVLADAEAAGYSVSNIFVTGHSLGAAEAEYVATQTGLSGTTFGTPGIPTGDIPASTTSVMTDYVERGDPVGNYAVGWNDQPLLQAQDVQHFGTAVVLGSYESAALIYAADATYVAAINAPTKAEEVAGIAAAAATLYKAAVEYHALTTYARDLGVTITGASGSTDGADGGTALIAGLFGSIPGVTVLPNGALNVSGADLTAPGAVTVSAAGLTLPSVTPNASLPLLNPLINLSLQSDGQGGTTISFSAASDGIVFGGSNGATIQGDGAPLTFIGGSGAVSVIGGSGAATLYGSTSSTTTTFLVGGSSNSNQLYGGAGASTLVAGSGASTLVGGSGPTLLMANGANPDEIVAGSGASTVNGLYGSGPEAVFAGSGGDIIALGSGADSAFGGSGVASIIGGSGPDVYGFVNGHAGGSDIIVGLKANDVIAFGGYGATPITSEGVVKGSDLITLSDGTVILLAGIDHKIFN
ncbi:beta strand repeat-containing protein [Acidisoma silvae]|uniref:Fungal lipase-like domain-containing protein n=1 Tax=Acidisoma silvae TaxID=2802396 RepID=A0A963YSJ6_9PROT|nr:hypothetical protein [Acidisoma silvae]MCB8876232.1 hypothetical protein [Acidisoma silvae]